MRSSEETYEAVEIVGEELGAPAGEDLAAERLGRTHVEDEEGKGVGEGVAGAEPGVVQVDDGELEKYRLAAALWERGERRGHGGSGDDDVGVGGEKGVDGGRLDPVEELVGNQLPVQLWQLGVRRDEVGVGGRSGIGRVCRKIHRICRRGVGFHGKNTILRITICVTIHRFLKQRIHLRCQWRRDTRRYIIRIGKNEFSLLHRR